MAALLTCLLLVGAGASASPGGFAAAGGSLPVLPLAALGLALVLERLRAWTASRPGRVLAAGGVALVLWNHLLMEQYRRFWIPRDDTVAFSRVAGNGARVLAGWTGSPLSWPANWAFAARHSLPAHRYDDMVGRFLFHGPSSLGGVIDVGKLPRGDGPLAEGWSNRHPCGTEQCRDVQETARLFVPLDVPRDLDLSVRAQGTGPLSLQLNGRLVATWRLEGPLRDLDVTLAREHWRHGLNEIRFTRAAQGRARINRLLLRAAGPVGSGLNTTR